MTFSKNNDMRNAKIRRDVIKIRCIYVFQCRLEGPVILNYDRKCYFSRFLGRGGTSAYSVFHIQLMTVCFCILLYDIYMMFRFD